MKKLSIIFVVLIIGNIYGYSEEHKMVEPTIELYPASTWNVLFFDETNYTTCINSKFALNTYFSKSEPLSSVILDFYYTKLLDEAGYIQNVNVAYNQQDFGFFDKVSIEELFPNFNWNSFTSPKIFYLVVYYHSEYLLSTSTNGVYPYENRYVVKRTFYPKTKAGSIKITPDLTTSKTIEYNTSPEQFSGVVASGGNESFSYQWQKLENGSTSWVDIYSANSQNYYPEKLTKSTVFRRISIPNTCGPSLISNQIAITVLPNINPGEIGTSQTVCYGTNISIINVLGASGGTGTYQYTWESSTDGAYFQTIPGQTDPTYAINSPTTTTFYRRKCTSGVNYDYSNIVKILVRGELTPGTVSSTQTICYGMIPNQLVGTLPGGGDSNYNYSWEVSLNNSTWTAIPNSNNSTYQPEALVTTSYFRRVVTSGSGCGSKYSVPIVIHVFNNLTAGSISANQSICYGVSPTQLVGTDPDGGDGNYTYKWELSLNNSNYFEIPLASNSIYQPGVLTTTSYFRRVVTSGSGCGSKYSTPVTVTVLSNLNPGIITSAQTICYGEKPTKLIGNAATGANNSFIYQWKYSENGNSWSDLPGANSLDFQPNSLTVPTYFKRFVSTGCGTGETPFIIVNVYPELKPGEINSTQTLCFNSTPTLISGTLPVGGDGNYTFNWEISLNNSTWTAIPNSNNSTYQPGALVTTSYFRRVVTSGSGCGNLVSTPISITVYNKLNPGAIYDNQSICYGSTPTAFSGTLATGADGKYNYQWKYSENGTDWNEVTGAMGIVYQALKLNKTTWYKRATYSGCGNLYTDSIKVIVKEEVNPGEISGPQTICYSNVPDKLTGTNASGGFDSYKYLWQVSTNNIDYEDLPLAISKDYQPGNISYPTYFQRKVTDINCGSYYSNPVFINTLGKLPTPDIFYRSFYCQNSEVLLSAGSDFTYNWHNANNQLVHTGASYSIPNISDNQVIFLKAKNNQDCYSDAQTISIKVDKVKADFTIGAAEIREGDPIKFNNLSENAIHYLWDFSEGEQSIIKSPWHIFNIPGVKQVSLIAYSLNECTDTIYRKNITVSPTGNKEILSLNIKLYPNPVTNYLNIEFSNEQDEKEIMLLNHTGVLIEKGFAHKNIQLTMDKYPAGLYFLNVYMKNEKYTYKIIKL